MSNLFLKLFTELELTMCDDGKLFQIFMIL